MSLYGEAILYSLQIIIAFVYAGPKLAQAERQRTLSRHPAWLLTNPEFLRTHKDISTLPFHAAAWIGMSLVAIGLFAQSQLILVVAHQPVFLALVLGLIFYCIKTERAVLAGIPKEPIQRAPLIPRSTFRFLSFRSLLPLAVLFFGVILLNGVGVFKNDLAMDRALGNIAFMGTIAGISWYGILETIKRQPYRTTLKTDNQGRTFELHSVLAATYFCFLMSLYYTLGSLGSSPVFSLPPTMLHALIESKPFPWDAYLQAFQYRIVDYAASVFVIALLMWTVTHPFYRKVLAVRFDQPHPIP